MANAAHLAERADALEAIIEDGMSATLYETNPNASPQWDPDYPSDAATAIYVLRLEEQSVFQSNTGLGDGLTIADSIKLMVAQYPDALQITLGDEIEMDGIRRTVTEAKPFAPGGTIIYWDVLIARG